MNPRRHKGFTLIELLVVIAIIALLMGILMPALAKVREIAKDVAGRSNLKQWALIINMYTTDNDGKYWDAWSNSGDGHLWIEATRPYFNDPKILFCPKAKVPRVKNPADAPDKGSMSQLSSTRPDEAWGYFSENDPRRDYAGMAGSYGENKWIGYSKNSKYWPSVNITGGSEVPSFLDAVWLGGSPEEDDGPPLTEEKMYPCDYREQMWQFLPNRHNGAINSAFLDSSVRKVSLKELWTLKWHREFETKDPSKNPWISKSSNWPEWMNNFDDGALLP